MTGGALERGEDFLSRYGGRISSEWYFPKLIELWLEDRHVYEEGHAFIEATDWIVGYVTGVERRQACTAGYKAMWSADDGLPPVEYFEAAYPGFETPAEKLGRSFVPLGTLAGTLRPEVAQTGGLPEAVSGAGGNLDSVGSVPGCGVERAGTDVPLVGAPTADMLLYATEISLPGI